MDHLTCPACEVDRSHEENSITHEMIECKVEENPFLARRNVREVINMSGSSSISTDAVSISPFALRSKLVRITAMVIALFLTLFIGGLISYAVLPNYKPEPRAAEVLNHARCHFSCLKSTLYLDRDTSTGVWNFSFDPKPPIIDGSYFLFKLNLCTNLSQAQIDQLWMSREDFRALQFKHDSLIASIKQITKKKDVAYDFNIDLNYRSSVLKTWTYGDVLYFYSEHHYIEDCCVIERTDQNILNSLNPIKRSEKLVISTQSTETTQAQTQAQTQTLNQTQAQNQTIES